MKTRTGLVAWLAVLTTAGQAWSQIDVRLDLQHKVALAFEPIEAVATIVNQSGRPIVLSEQRDDARLLFDVRLRPDPTFLPARRPLLPEPVPLAPGKPYEVKADLGLVFDLHREAILFHVGNPIATASSGGRVIDGDERAVSRGGRFRFGRLRRAGGKGEEQKRE